MSKLGFAIVGCGNIAPFHAEAIRDSEGAELVAVCDSVPENMEKLVKDFPAKTYSDYAELLKDSAVDVVNICLPSGMHAKFSIDAANAGKHVMVEKPLDITLKKCDDIINACKDNNVKLATFFFSRFKPAPMAVKKAIAAGRFGKLTVGDVSVKWFRSDEYYASGDWRGTWEFDGGGALMNQSIHYIDVLQDIMGPVESISANCSTLVRKIEVEDTAVAILKFKNGALGTITGTTSIYPGLDPRFGIHGEYGSAVIVGETLETWDFVNKLPEDEEIMASASETKSSGAGDPTANLQSSGHQLQVADMVKAINEDRKPIIDGESGKKAVEIIHAIYESSRNGGKVVQL